VSPAELQVRSGEVEDGSASRGARGLRLRHRRAIGVDTGAIVVTETERGRHDTQDQEDLDDDDDRDEDQSPERVQTDGGQAPRRSIEWAVHQGPQ
jgi:hypothetical protein